MAQQQGGQVEKVQPEDPEYSLEDHVLFKRKQEVLSKSLKEILQSGVSEFELTMDGTTFAYTKLALPNRGIKEMNEQIWEYQHLRKIDFSFNRLQNINSLIKLKYLINLDLSRNVLQDVNFLSNDSIFVYIKSINLLGNQIISLPPVQLRNLTHLNLNNNLISTLEDFAGHKKLQVLELRGNRIQSLDGLKKLDSLRELYIAENRLENLNGLGQAPSLAKINARKNKITKFETFPDLKALKYLNLRENAIAKVEDVSKIGQSVENLNILANPISDELADNVKKEIFMKFRHYEKINKSEITAEEKEEFDKQYKERLAEQARQEAERKASQEEAAREAAQKAQQQNQ